MIRVSAKGWGWVYENPEQAVEILVERYPNMDLEAEKKEVGLITAYSFDDNTAKGGWGTMSVENWQDQINIYDQLGQFENGTLADLVNFSVLEATAADRPTYG
jgi:NitT/TauT family transport system substrate-binding protein